MDPTHASPTPNPLRAADLGVRLRALVPADLDIFFEQQKDPAANFMAAFTAKDPADRPAFLAHWEKVQADPQIVLRAILWQGQVAGHIVCHAWFGEPEISYWLGREYWGQGIASQALAAFLLLLPRRPLYARVAKDNTASRRVLEKCGFKVIGEDKGFANARNQEVEEFILALGDALDMGSKR